MQRELVQLRIQMVRHSTRLFIAKYILDEMMVKTPHLFFFVDEDIAKRYIDALLELILQEHQVVSVDFPHNNIVFFTTTEKGIRVHRELDGKTQEQFTLPVGYFERLELIKEFKLLNSMLLNSMPYIGSKNPSTTKPA